MLALNSLFRLSRSIVFSFLRFQLLFRRVDPEQRQDRCLRHTSSRAQDVLDICWQ